MPTNDRDIRTMADTACRLRDETYGCCKWDSTGTFVVFKEVLLGWDLGEAWRRVIGHATDAEAKTPGAIKRPFVPDAPKADYRHPVKAGEDCRRHVGEVAHACRLCAVEGYTHPEDPTPDPTFAAARALGRGPFRQTPEETS